MEFGFVFGKFYVYGYFSVYFILFCIVCFFGICIRGDVGGFERFVGIIFRVKVVGELFFFFLEGVRWVWYILFRLVVVIRFLRVVD